MKIGIFMAYRPGVQMGSEGLGRYIGNLTKGFIDGGHQVSIACPIWSLESLYDLFDDFFIRREQVEIISTKHLPVIMMLFNRMMKDKERTYNASYKQLLLYSVTGLTDKLLNIFSAIGGMLAYCVTMVLIVLIGLALLPLMLVAGLLALLAWVGISVIRRSKLSISAACAKLRGIFQKYSQKGYSVYEAAYQHSYAHTVKMLVSKIERSKKDVWLIPTLFWPEASEIKGLTVFVAPDMVTTEFPYPFAEDDSCVTATQICAETIKRGEYFITYCDYIKKDVLMKRYQKKEDHIISVGHINNSSLDYVDIQDGTEGLEERHEVLNQQFCRELLQCLPDYSAQKEFLKDYDFSRVQYIFYASQQRPHKNILTLLKAYEYLRRNKHITFKLFLTCDLESTPGLIEFIHQHHLEHDVIAFKRVPVQLLSALYACASLVVNPTLYEGAFLTYPIGEGMSVGTPSIMGRIPQVTDMIPSIYPLEQILFDPLDYMDMAEKILYGVENADKLYQDELSMYHEIEQRTGPVVAQVYVDAFHAFEEIYRNENRKQVTQ